MEELVDRYADHARRFVRDVWQIEPEPWQDEGLEQYEKRTRRISIRSGHGVGKTAWLSWMIIHHALTRFPQKCAVTAPTSTQMWDALWPEIKAWINRLPPELRGLLDVKADRIELIKAPERSFISAKTSRPESPEAMAGVHSDWVLLIGDEASGIHEQIFESASGSMSGANAMMILTGNPVRGSGFFFETHTRLAEKWWTKKVSVFESRWSGGQAYADEIAETYGINSNAYRVRVLGEFPVADDDTVIPFDLIEAAGLRDVAVTESPIIWGLDVARFGHDRTALAKRKGNFLLEPIRWWVKKDLMETSAMVKLEWDQTPQRDRPVQINIDSIGMGAGVVDRLQELDLPAAGVNVSESPSAMKGEQYRNLRAELWFAMREWFAARNNKIPRQEELIRDLAMPRYRFTPQGKKIYIESKEEMRKRGRPSPDLAEALMMTFASEAIILAGGSSAYGLTSWKEALHRPLKGLV